MIYTYIIITLYTLNILHIIFANYASLKLGAGGGRILSPSQKFLERISLHLPLPSTVSNLLSASIGPCVLDVSCKWNRTMVGFHVWLLALSITFPRFIHVVAGIAREYSSIWTWRILLYLGTTWCTFGLFPLFGSVNHATPCMSFRGITKAGFSHVLPAKTQPAVRLI